MSKTTQNYKFFCTVDNFSSLDKELIFGDFRIIKQYFVNFQAVG